MHRINNGNTIKREMNAAEIYFFLQFSTLILVSNIQILSNIQRKVAFEPKVQSEIGGNKLCIFFSHFRIVLYLNECASNLTCIRNRKVV